MKKIAVFCMIVSTYFILNISSAYASLTKEQSDDVAEFATTFISEGNERRDKNGYPLLVYALSSNGNTCIEIRSSGYNDELYYIKNNRYHSGRELGYKWCMDCGAFMAYVYKTTCGFDLVNPKNGDPWHITDFRDDANKGANSKYFEYVYKNVPISSIDESKLMPGDLVIRFGPKDNHGLVYIGEGWIQAHASYNAIRYDKKPPITGFQVVKGFYKKSTVVSIIRVKDGILPEDYIVKSKIIWPDNGEEQILTSRYKSFLAMENEVEIDIENEEEKKPVNIEISVYSDDIETLVEEAFKDKSIMLYIEKEMYSWMTDGVKRLIRIDDDSQAEND